MKGNITLNKNIQGLKLSFCWREIFQENLFKLIELSSILRKTVSPVRAFDTRSYTLVQIKGIDTLLVDTRGSKLNF